MHLWICENESHYYVWHTNKNILKETKKFVLYLNVSSTLKSFLYKTVYWLESDNSFSFSFFFSIFYPLLLLFIHSPIQSSKQLYISATHQPLGYRDKNTFFALSTLTFWEMEGDAVNLNAECSCHWEKKCKPLFQKVGDGAETARSKEGIVGCPWAEQIMSESGTSMGYEGTNTGMSMWFTSDLWYFDLVLNTAFPNSICSSWLQQMSYHALLQKIELKEYHTLGTGKEVVSQPCLKWEGVCPTNKERKTAQRPQDDQGWLRPQKRAGGFQKVSADDGSYFEPYETIALLLNNTSFSVSF